MPRSTTIAELLGTAARRPDDPQVHRNHDGAIVAIGYTEAGWAAVDPALRTEHGGQRSVITHCPVRGTVSVDAFVTPAFSAAAPKPWSRAPQGGRFYADAA